LMALSSSENHGGYFFSIIIIIIVIFIITLPHFFCYFFFKLTISVKIAWFYFVPIIEKKATVQMKMKLINEINKELFCLIFFS
jgi:hypothetical protein